MEDQSFQLNVKKMHYSVIKTTLQALIQKEKTLTLKKNIRSPKKGRKVHFAEGFRENESEGNLTPVTGEKAFIATDPSNKWATPEEVKAHAKIITEKHPLRQGIRTPPKYSDQRAPRDGIPYTEYPPREQRGPFPNDVQNRAASQQSIHSEMYPKSQNRRRYRRGTYSHPKVLTTGRDLQN